MGSRATSEKAVTSVGCVHGRFQPFHREHLDYVRRAKTQCDFLWIGLTQFDRHRHKGASRRSQRSSNPLTYWERVKMIRRVLAEDGTPSSAFGFTPFPIDSPDDLPHFIGTEVVCYTTICEPWNREKIELLEDLGYSVSVVVERSPKQVSGHEIREGIMNGTDAWQQKLPEATVAFVKEISLRDRLLRLVNSPNETDIR